MGRPRASLTFDDGPHPQTLDLLELLDRFAVPATFFQCGVHVRARPEIARRVAGSHEIGNHTDTHPSLWRSLPSTIAQEVARAQASIVEATGVTPRLFRCPYGVPGIGLRRALAQHGLTKTGWTVIGNDWKLRAPEIASRVLESLTPGANICLHDGRDRNPEPDIRETIEAVHVLVPAILDRGYEFVTLSELLWPKTTSPGA